MFSGHKKAFTVCMVAGSLVATPVLAEESPESQQPVADEASTPATTSSSSNEVKAHGVLFAGLEFGGDLIATGIFDNGDVETLDAGEGIYFGGGGAFPVSADGSIEVQLTLGLKMGLIPASNGGIDFTRFPVEALLFYRGDKFRVGVGPTIHLSPTLTIDSTFVDTEVDFDSAAGIVLEADFFITDDVYFGARFTEIEYETSVGSIVYDGSSFGLNVGARFK
ncbi:MAG: hypothetical protein OEY67_07470 [Gammaproteobacteria bacterium]|nr:hypothetical protein [Gammaproteobacteria bacterium]